MAFEPFPCPHCGQPGVSVVRKLALGPALPATCTACRGKVGVPWSSMLFPVLPWFAITMGSAFLPTVLPALPALPGQLVSTRVSVLIAVAGVSWLALSWYWLYRVPLVRR